MITQGSLEGRVRALWEQAFNGRDLSVIDAITAPEFVNHNALPGTPPGPEGHRQVVQRIWQAIGDAHFEIKHLARDGDHPEFGRSPLRSRVDRAARPR